MRFLFAQHTLRRTFAGLVFAVLLLGPLGVCCHEHQEDDAHTKHGTETHLCAGICVCHFSITISDMPSTDSPDRQPDFQCAVNEREPRSCFIADIDHPPKIVSSI